MALGGGVAVHAAPCDPRRMLSGVGGSLFASKRGAHEESRERLRNCADKACREGFTALYHRLPRLFPDLAIAKADLCGVVPAGRVAGPGWGTHDHRKRWTLRQLLYEPELPSQTIYCPQNCSGPGKHQQERCYNPPLGEIRVYSKETREMAALIHLVTNPLLRCAWPVRTQRGRGRKDRFRCEHKRMRLV